MYSLAMLRRIPFFSKLKPADLKEVYKISQIKEYGPGEPIFDKHTDAQQMFIVLNGRVKIYTPSSSKKRKTFAYLRPGDFFGEMALLEGKPRSASAEASAYTKLLTIAKRDFQRLLTEDHPELSLYLLKVFSERLRRANEEIEGFLFRNILGRVAKTLNDLSKRGEKSRGGITLPEHYTQQELADLVGTTREPLTRALSALKRAQLVEFVGGRYFIKDPEKLSSLCVIEG